jgi:hypothetical protein
MSFLPTVPTARMPFRLASFALCALSTIAAETWAAAPGAEAITEILTSSLGWTVFIDTTPELKPTDRATKAGYQFLRRGTEVVGRTTALAEGFNCEFKVRVRGDGIDLHPRSRACNDRYGDDAPYTLLDFDPADAVYPFKRLNVPQKWWLSPQR